MRFVAQRFPTSPFETLPELSLLQPPVTSKIQISRKLYLRFQNQINLLLHPITLWRKPPSTSVSISLIIATISIICYQGDLLTFRLSFINANFLKILAIRTERWNKGKGSYVKSVTSSLLSCDVINENAFVHSNNYVWVISGKTWKSIPFASSLTRLVH